MVVGLITVAALTAKMSATAAAGQKVMDKQAQLQAERDKRNAKR